MRVEIIIVPAIICLIIIYAIIHKVNVFNSFIEGAKEGLETVIGILPTLVGLLAAITMLQASGAIDVITSALKPLANLIGIPEEVVPLALLKPISGSGSLAVCDNIMSTYHPDSLIGRIASVMQGSTETTFYSIAVYYGSVSIADTRYTLPSALMGDIVSIIFSCLFVRILF